MINHVQKLKCIQKIQVPVNRIFIFVSPSKGKGEAQYLEFLIAFPIGPCYNSNDKDIAFICRPDIGDLAGDAQNLNQSVAEE